MKMRLLSRAAALTIVELLISGSLASLAIGALFAGSVALQRHFSAATQFAESQADQIRALDYIEMDLRRAQTVTLASGSTPITVTLPNYYQTVSNRKVARDPVKSGPYVQYGTGTVTVTYSLQGNNLIRTEAGVAKTIATSIASLPQPTRSGNTVTTTVTFTSPLTLNGAKKTVTLSSKALLRNLQ